LRDNCSDLGRNESIELLIDSDLRSSTNFIERMLYKIGTDPVQGWKETFGPKEPRAWSQRLNPTDSRRAFQPVRSPGAITRRAARPTRPRWTVILHPEMKV
jgi:hypothetical protein